MKKKREMKRQFSWLKALIETLWRILKKAWCHGRH